MLPQTGLQRNPERDNHKRSRTTSLERASGEKCRRANVQDSRCCVCIAGRNESTTVETKVGMCPSGTLHKEFGWYWSWNADWSEGRKRVSRGSVPVSVSTGKGRCYVQQVDNTTRWKDNVEWRSCCYECSASSCRQQCLGQVFYDGPSKMGQRVAEHTRHQSYRHSPSTSFGQMVLSGW